MAAEGSSTVNKSGTAKVFQKPLPLACKRQRLFSFTSAVLFRAHRQNHSHPCLLYTSGQPEYLQAVLTWLEMIAPALEDNPIYERVDLLTRMVEPDRMLTFTVPWMDDQGMAHTNHGYRVQFNSAIGPYKGCLLYTSPPCTRASSSFWALSRSSRTA